MTHDLFSSALSSLGPFERAPHVAVAVSGGPDSMALLLLTREWASAQGGGVTAITVDHGLRSESAREAEEVAKRCHALGIPHVLLKWQSPRTGTRIQEMAREMRYRLMGNWCREHGVLHLLTAHHQGDQAETLLFRLARGSSPEGLSSMPLVTPMRNVRLLRPLLNVPKAALLQLLEAQGERWMEDPSNTNPRYARSRIRAALARQPDAESLIRQAAELAARFGAVRGRMNEHLASRAAQHCVIFPEAYAFLDAAALQDGYAGALISALTRTLSGDAYPRRTQKLERLMGDLTRIAGSDQPSNRTFGGCIFRWQPKRQRFLVCREAKAIAKPLELTGKQLWDGRFLVESSGPVTVRALGAEGRKKLAELGKRSRLPPPVIATLPSFWRLEELLAVPHMNYRRESGDPVCHARFRPVKPLAGAAFFGLNRR